MLYRLQCIWCIYILQTFFCLQFYMMLLLFSFSSDDVFNNLSCWYFHQFELVIFTTMWAVDIFTNLSRWCLERASPIIGRAVTGCIGGASFLCQLGCLSDQNRTSTHYNRSVSGRTIAVRGCIVGGRRFLPSPTLRSPIVMTLLPGQKQAHKQIQTGANGLQLLTNNW